jgi:hypothetical protein
VCIIGSTKGIRVATLYPKFLGLRLTGGLLKMVGTDSAMLGRFLVDLHSDRNALSSIQATITHMYNPVLGDHAACRLGKSIGLMKHLAAGAYELDAWANRQTVVNVRMMNNGNTRVEGRRSFGNEVISFLSVSNGSTTLERGSDQPNHVTQCTRETAGQLIWAHRHFDAATIIEFLSQLEVHADGLAKAAGQECVRLRCVPRKRSNLWSHWLPYCADVYEFYADPEHCALLRIAGYTDGRLYEEYKVTEIGFDEPIDPVVFSLDLDPGESIRVDSDCESRVSLDRLAESVSFVMFLPKDLIIRDLNLSVWRREYDPAMHKFRLCYVSNSDDKLLQINQTDQISRITAHVDQYLWTTMSYKGREFQLSDPGIDRGERIISLMNGTTYIEIASAIELEKLADIALSLEPVDPATESNSFCEICLIK